jgi:AhpD family alkylhydroperoxidase
MSKYRTSLNAVTLDSADAYEAVVLERGQKGIGFIPNMYANMANSPGLLETYMDGYERFRKYSGFTATEQEVVFLTISRYNRCTYCMAAHSMIAEHMSGVSNPDLQALRSGTPLPTANLRVLSEFVTHMLETGGFPDQELTDRFTRAGYKEKQILEILLAMSVKLLSNYSNHLFETRLDDAFSSYAWSEN